MLKKIRKPTKGIAISLVLAILISIFPSSAMNMKSTAEKPSNAVNERKIIGEDISKRDKFSKTYIYNDGTSVSIVTALAQNYLENGIWKDIDNTLSLTKDENGNEIYQNSKNSYTAEIPKDLATEKPITIKKDNYKLSFALKDNINKTSATMLEPSSSDKKSDLEKTAKLETKSSEIKYSNIKNKTDIKYSVKPDEFKEEIVINAEPSGEVVYTYEVLADRLSAKLLDDNSIEFYSIDGASESVFILVAPFMYDQDGSYCKDIKVSLTQDEKGAYSLCYRPSLSWLKEKQRKYPIVVDPTVQTSKINSNVDDSLTYSNNSYSEFLPGAWSIMLLGYDPTPGAMVDYIKFNSLPELNESDIINNVSLNLYYSSFWGSGNSTETVSKVLTSWTESTICGKNQPESDYKIIDYFIANSSTTSQYNKFDITSVAREWYKNGENYGVQLKSINNTTSCYSYIQSSECGNTSQMPYMEIEYTNATGIESYWDYHTQNIGRAGNVSVNDYTGNLVLQQEQIGVSGNRLPVNIQRVFNTNDKDTNIGYGYGYRTNYNRRIIQGTNLITYIDEDGTSHYFTYNSTSGKWLDEAGTSLEIEAAGGYSPGNQKYRLTDGSGLKYLFDSNGRLTYIQDSNPTPNQVSVTYTDSTGDKISSITDGAGRIYNFIYNSDNTLLQQINYMDSNNEYALKTVSYVYTNGDLTSVTFPDDKTVQYIWNTGHLLYEAVNIDNAKLKYTYTSNKVTKVECFGTDSSAGKTLDIVYGNNQTTFTNYNGTKEIKQFNNNGNTLSVRDEKGNANFGRYAEPGDTNYKKNQLVRLSSVQNTSVNLIRNYNFEDTDHSMYSTYSEGGSGTVVWDASPAYIGSKSVSIEKTSSDDAGIYGKKYQTGTVTAGKTYTFSAWVKTTGLSNATEGAKIDISYVSGSTETKVSSKRITTNGDWQKLDASIEVPSNASSPYLRFYLTVGNVGKVYFDCLQAGETKTGVSANFVDNGDFAYQGVTASDAYLWTGENLTTTDLRTTESTSRTPIDSSCFTIAGSPTTVKRIYQTIALSGSAGDSYTISSWAKAFAVPLVYTGTPSTDKDFAIKVKVYNGSTALETYRFPFNAQSNDWQYMADTFTTQNAYTSIEVSLVYANQCNAAYFDGVELCKENFGNIYTYDANGNLTTATDKNGAKTTITYDSNKNPDTITDAENNTTDFNINASKQLLDTTSDEGVKGVFTYDDFGNILTYLISNNTLSIQSSVSYDGGGNYTDKVTDELGNITDYDYNKELGTLDKVTDAKGKATSYSYNSMGSITSVSKDVSGLYNKNSATPVANSYSYTNDKLSSIAHNNFNYGFIYNGMGNLTDVSVGSQNILTNNYKSDDRTFNLAETIYHNSATSPQSIQYYYDSHNNLTSVRRNNNANDTFFYKYDNTDVLLSKTDTINNLFTSFGYDAAHRINLTSESGINGRNYIHSYGNEFSSVGLISRFLETINGTAFETAFAFNGDNKLIDSTFNYVSGTNKGRKSVVYDTLGRVSTTNLSKIISDVPAQFAGTNYTYTDLPNNKTTNQIASMTLSGGAGDNAYNWLYSYTYDKNNNIKTQSIGGVLKYTYTYDQLNQLTRVDDAVANKSTTYTYDEGGNIREKKEYAYTTGTLGTPTATIPYGYTDSNWKDKLTSYNGNAITYDNIGNPLTYNGWTYTWEAGRQLAVLNNAGTTTSYKYNDSGIRTQKTVNGVTTDYTLVDDRVTAETNGTDTIYYRYDGNNDLISMNLNGAEYYYLRNQQNDIIGLVDDSGTVVVQYSYDVWGKLLSTTGSLASTVGVKNPYLYRGYRFDSETGLYYLQSRYYNPDFGRFINADDTGVLQATQDDFANVNLFAYCGNNPVMNSDPSGYYHFTTHFILAIAGMAAIVTYYFHIVACLAGWYKIYLITYAALISSGAISQQYWVVAAVIGIVIATVATLARYYWGAVLLYDTMKSFQYHLARAFNPWHRD